MKSYTHKSFIDKHQKRGIRFSLAGFMIMVVAFVLAWIPDYAPWSWPILLIGVVVATVGTYYVNRWVRPPLAEKVLEEAFERLSSRYVLFNHTGIVPHLLLTPKGLVVIKVKRYEGPVRYNAESGKWKGKFSFRRFYGQGLTAETLGNPTEEIKQQTEQVRAWLKLHLPEFADSVPVAGIALFLSPKTEFSGDEPPQPVAQPDSIKKEAQQVFRNRKPLPRHVYNALRDALEDELPDELQEAA